MVSRSFMNSLRGQTLEQMYVFSVLAMLVVFLVKYLTHEAANETMIAVLNTAIGGVVGMLGMAVSSVFQTQKNASARASDGPAAGGLTPPAASPDSAGAPISPPGEKPL